MATFTPVLVARSPSATGAPHLAEVDRLVAGSLSYVDELNRPGSATLSVRAATMSPAVKDRLADLGRFPCEVWVYRDAALAWAGEVQTLGVQDQAVTLNCVGLLGYLQRMGIRFDTTFTGVDQLTIPRQLVDTWQAQSYGHYGIDTAGGPLSGVLRDRTYLQKDLKDVLSAVTELGAVIDGFDLAVDPATRKLGLFYPRRGQNLAAATILDGRTIVSASIAQSVAPDDLVSDVGAMSSAQDEQGGSVSLHAYRERLSVQSSFGRTWRGQSFDSISEQPTLDAKADAYLATRGQQMLQPGLTLRLNPGTGVTAGAIRPGDTVGYAYDAGLGLQAGGYRVNKVTTAVDDDGKPSLALEFI